MHSEGRVSGGSTTGARSARRAAKAARAAQTRADRLPAIAAVLAIVTWTIFFAWAGSPVADTAAGPALASALIIDWAVPVLLVIGIWLLALRYRRSNIIDPEAYASPPPTQQREVTPAASAPVAGETETKHEAAIAAPGARVDELTSRRVDAIRLQAERFQTELDTREQDNLSAIRRRADELAKALSAQDIAMRRDFGQGMDELQARFKSMREDSLRLSGELERVQSDSLRGWELAVEDLETRMQNTVGRVIEVDDAAMENARTRLATLHEEAERVDAAAAERLLAFEAGIALRRDAALESGNTALAGIEDQLATFDAQLVERRDAVLAGGGAALDALDGQLATFDQRLADRREDQLARVAELGERSEALAARMAEIDRQLAGHVEQCEAASDALGGFAGDLSGQLAQSRNMLEHSGQSLAEMTEAGQRLFDLVRASAEETANTIPAALTQAQDRLGAFDERTRAVHDAIGQTEAKSAALVRHLEKAREAMPVSSDTLDALSYKLEEIVAQADKVAQRTRHDLRKTIEEMEGSVQDMGAALHDRLVESRDLLEHSGQSLAEMTQAGQRLFDLIEASAQRSTDVIPTAIAQAHERLGAFEKLTGALRESIGETEAKSAALVIHLEKAREGVPVSAETLDTLSRRLEEIAAQSDNVAQRTRADLREAIEELEGSSQAMAARLREGQEEALREFAATFGERSLEIVGKGLREKTETAIAELEHAASGVGRAGLETVDQLRSGLNELDEMAGNLEARLSTARQQAQDEPTKDFSIEMTKITEGLNSGAIDITKVFTSDVPDTAWQAYLRGDYGVFTRKAVKLLSSPRADALLDRYKADAALRETINRYIGDFESMLRVILATRNGHMMAVTMLSSDIGKLYVALAQATDRLRS